MRTTKIICHFWPDRTEPVPLGITVGETFYRIGTKFADNNTARILGYVGKPDVLTSRLFTTITLCVLQGAVPLSRLADLGVWTATGRCIHRDLSAAFVEVEGQRLLQFTRRHAVGEELQYETISRAQADDEDAVVRLVLPRTCELTFDNDGLARTYVAQLYRDAQFPGYSSEQTELSVYVTEPDLAQHLLLETVRSWAFQVYTPSGPQDALWRTKVVNAAAMLMGVGQAVAPFQYLQLGFALANKVPIILALPDKDVVLDAVMQTLEASNYKFNDRKLIERLHACVAPRGVQLILGKISALVAKALSDHHSPESPERLPERMQPEKSIATATRKQQQFGYEILNVGRGMGRFLNLFTRYADRRYKQPMSDLVEQARAERVSLTSIVRSICLAEPFNPEGRGTC